MLSIENEENACYCPDALSGTDTGEVNWKKIKTNNTTLEIYYLQGCLTINSNNDSYTAYDCPIWCRSGTLRVGAAYGIPGVVMSAPHFLFGDPDLPYEVSEEVSQSDKTARSKSLQK